MEQLKPTFPDPLILAEMAKEDLARLVLGILQKWCAQPGSYSQGRQGVRAATFISNQIGDGVAAGGYGEAGRHVVAVPLMEAWSWLVRAGLLIPAYSESNYTANEYTLSRLGRSTTSDEGFSDVVTQARFSPALLHPEIAKVAWPRLRSNDEGGAVFEAFKAVEVAVRAAGGFTANDIGRDLMARAFNAERGPLRDASAIAAEREARALLFQGAAGAYKNPGSHRETTIDLGRALEMVMLASLLMHIVDERAAAGITPLPS